MSLNKKANEKKPQIWDENQHYVQQLVKKHSEKKGAGDRFQALIEESETVYEIIEANGTIKYISDASTKVINYKPEKLIGEKIYKLYKGKELEKLAGMIDFVLENPSSKSQNVLTYKKKSGQNVYLEVSMQNLLGNPAIEGILLSFTNVTKRVKTEEKLHYTVTHDELTNLPNRHYFKMLLAEQYALAKEKGTSLAVLMLDFEKLKYINDALGFHFGDQMIIKIMIRLKMFLKSDQLMGRYAEDQFGIIVKNLADMGAYETLAKNLVALFLPPFKVDNYEFEVSMSMGISLFSKECRYMDTRESADGNGEFLIKQANIALLWAKKEGKNKYKYYCTDFSIQNYKQFELRNDFRKAIKKNQFEIFYQPVVKLKNRKILVVEALIRWNHPAWGLVSPDEFIYLAEETGSIIEMEKWMLKELCHNCKTMLKKGLPNPRVMVNFSSIQFFEKNFAQHIHNIFDEFKLNPKLLIVKVTENLLTNESENIQGNIQKLRSMGIKVALNDASFSLSCLKNFNIDVLIMDGSFLNNIFMNKASALMVQTVVNLTRELNIKLMATGIENWEQISFLQQLNCYAGQGNIFSRPLPKNTFKKILEKGTCEPLLPRSTYAELVDERRNYFRLIFHKYLQADLVILKIKEKIMDVGNTKILIRDIGPGGLCFISDIQFPVERAFTLQFETSLLDKKIKVYGNPVHIEELSDHLYQYGVKFSINEDERDNLMKILFEVQIKVKKSTVFEDRSFTADAPADYFKVPGNSAR
ncbi:EAL domain-containing protein [Acetobacterium bakii]|uniref:Diguanylate cyclase n=1 Tax=Acetobacterium bakii TaxID=52689 RepID=A0A0L6TYH3_9FIRM|nr:EAL domain-containing protein [Acetobacterium bakii]KNZ41319.1 hypothetical protein AKG39_12590 [Acetobacterium bakii]